MDRDIEVGALFGTPGEALWLRQLGSADAEAGRGIASDNQGNMVAVGAFSRTISVSADARLDSAGLLDIYVVKLDGATGDLLWAKRFGSSGSDSALGVAIDDSGAIYVVGNVSGTVDLGRGPLSTTGGSALFALRLNPSGDTDWARVFSGLVFPGGISVGGDSVVLTGSHFGSVVIDATTFTAASGQTDMFVLKLSTLTGATTWVKGFAGTSDEAAHGIALDSNGNVVLTGGYFGTLSFGGSTLSTNGEQEHMFLVKLASADGSHLFSRSFGGPGHDFGEAVVVDSLNDIVVTGSFEATVDFGCFNTPTASQPNVSDIFLAKYTQAGACVWAKGFGGTAGVGTLGRTGSGVSVNRDGDVAATGLFRGSISFGGEVFTSASTISDMFVARFDEDGTHVNSLRGGGAGSETGRGIVQSSDNRIFVIGEFEGFAEFGGETLTSAGVADAFVVGLAPL